MAGAAHRTAGRAILTVGVIALAFACVLAPAAAAKKKKKKIAVVTTSTTAVPVPPGSTQSTTASCQKGLHITGGGFAISPEFSSNGTASLADDTGMKTLTQVSFPNGAGSWTSTTGSFSSPAAAGALTTFARCEHNKLGKYATTVFGSQALSSGEGTNINLQCPTGTHTLSGGFTVDKPFTNAVAASSKLFMLANYRTAPNVWTVSGFNINIGSVPVTTLTGYAICEKNGKLAVTESQASTPFSDNTSAVATAGCTKKHHAVGGGFSLSPVVAPGQSGAVPAAPIEESAPVGARDWTVHSYDFPNPGFTAPPGSALTAIAYCKADSAKKKKKKK